jgi:hypothetical protein
MSSAIMEINMPVGSSEMILKTAGKYCYKDIRVTAPHSFRIVTGSFELDARTTALSIGIPAGAKAIEIVPQGEIPAATSGNYPVTYVFGFCDVNYPGYSYGKALLAEYKYTSDTKPFGQSAFAPNTTDGFSMSLETGGYFFAATTYTYTAYYWDESAASTSPTDDVIGDIDAALDDIREIQNQLMGGGAV